MREVWSEDNFKFQSRDKTPWVGFEKEPVRKQWVWVAVALVMLLGVVCL